MTPEETEEFRALERANLIARIKKLEKKVDDYEWIMLFLFILVVSRMFF
jgi:hypothetical protein